MDTENIIREIDVWIDDFTPCLKDNLTGEVVNVATIISLTLLLATW